MGEKGEIQGWVRQIQMSHNVRRRNKSLMSLTIIALWKCQNWWLLVKLIWLLDLGGMFSFGVSTANGPVFIFCPKIFSFSFPAHFTSPSVLHCTAKRLAVFGFVMGSVFSCWAWGSVCKTEEYALVQCSLATGEIRLSKKEIDLLCHFIFHA